jgi:diacylglycerol kinase
MRRFFKGFRYALNGMASALRQPNLRIQLATAILAVAAGWYFDITAGEWLAVVIAIALVISMELMNTALEHLVDLISPEHHPKAGKVKDIAAGAVLAAAIAAVVIGVIVFWKYVMRM